MNWRVGSVPSNHRPKSLCTLLAEIVQTHGRLAPYIQRSDAPVVLHGGKWVYGLYLLINNSIQSDLRVEKAYFGSAKECAAGPATAALLWALSGELSRDKYCEWDACWDTSVGRADSVAMIWPVKSTLSPL